MLSLHKPTALSTKVNPPAIPQLMDRDITDSISVWLSAAREKRSSQHVGGISLLSVGGDGQVLLGGWNFKRVSNNIPDSGSDTAVA